MFEAPIDTWYVWLGLALVTTVAAGTATEFPTAPPPDAGATAAAIDRVSVADHDATAGRPVDADAMKLERSHLALRDDGRTSRARLARPVTPVRRDSSLRRVLLGANPGDVFDGRSPFREAVREARAGVSRWRDVERLVVRTVYWRGINVTLVGS